MKRTFPLAIALVIWGVISFITLVSCDDGDQAAEDDPVDGDDGDDDDDDDDNDNNDNDDTNSFEVIFETLLIDGAPAPPNPETGAATPDQYNKVPVFRFRQNTGDSPPRSVSAILILLPGYSGGATEYFYAARDLVTIAGGDLEVWVTERRANLLEDQTGFDAAELAQDPMLARNYYFDGLPIDGRSFPGWYEGSGSDLEMISEWGVDVMLNDLNRVVRHVPEQNRQTNLFMGGYSRGARFSQEYAAYRFADGRLGCEDLAGIVLWDRGSSLDFVRPSEVQYDQKLHEIRVGIRSRFTPPNLVSRVSFWAQFFAMTATEGYGPPGDPRFGPDGLYDDWGVFSLFHDIVSRGHAVRITNEALFGLLFDDESTQVNGFQLRSGRITGGTVGHDGIGDFPDQDGATYSWLNFDETQPEEMVDIRRLLGLIYEGPTDFIEAYFPSRLDLDETAIGDMETSNSWVDRTLPFYTSAMDAPVYCLQGTLTSGSGYCEDYLETLPPVRGESGDRTQTGFRFFDLPDWSHLEVLLVGPDRNPFYPDFLEWMGRWSEGEVRVPPFGN
jgi:hypothetical protein